MSTNASPRSLAIRVITPAVQAIVAKRLYGTFNAAKLEPAARFKLALGSIVFATAVTFAGERLIELIEERRALESGDIEAIDETIG
jgi:hypothetical protein